MLHNVLMIYLIIGLIHLVVFLLLNKKLKDDFDDSIRINGFFKTMVMSIALYLRFVFIWPEIYIIRKNNGNS